MPIDIVYFKSGVQSDFEQKVAAYGAVGTSHGDDKRSFLMALSEAVDRSDAVIAVGAISELASVLAKGLCMPLTPVDWTMFGISGQEEVALPQGALPLIVDGSVYGMIIESGAQCIIAVDSDGKALEHMTDEYILTYLDAVCKVQPESPVEIPAPQEAERDGEEEAESESEAEQSEVAEHVEADTAEDDFPHIQPVEYFAEEEVEEDSAPDIFADIDEDEFLIIDDRKRGHGWLIALICLVLVLVIAAVGGYFGYTKWWIPKQYDEISASVKEKYESGELKLNTNMPTEYFVRFGLLYEQNSDVIGWISADGIDIDAPIVTAVNKGDAYYKNHLYDGTENKYGTPYIEYAYDNADNTNPNLVVYGNNFGDGRAFAGIEKLLDSSTAGDVTITTDSVLYGEHNWRVFSVMLLDGEDAAFDYTDNFATLTELDERAERLRAALSLSQVALGVGADAFDGIGFTDSFLTLVAPHSSQKGKVVVVMAMQINDADETPSTVIDDQITE